MNPCTLVCVCVCVVVVCCCCCCCCCCVCVCMCVCVCSACACCADWHCLQHLHGVAEVSGGVFMRAAYAIQWRTPSL
ncbi:MAG TPA: hypothetical protein V6C97_03205 [Oculatellaceae cyanobacterium]